MDEKLHAQTPAKKTQSEIKKPSSQRESSNTSTQAQGGQALSTLAHVQNTTHRATSSSFQVICLVWTNSWNTWPPRFPPNRKFSLSLSFQLCSTSTFHDYKSKNSQDNPRGYVLGQGVTGQLSIRSSFLGHVYCRTRIHRMF